MAPQRDVELIVLRQAASFLATPIFIIGTDGALAYYNEAAERLLGRRYDEMGEMALEEWGSMFTPTDELGEPIPPDELPLARALAEHHPTTGVLHITALSGETRRIEVAAIPLVGQTGRALGALAVFWESDPAR